jgi:hypothetical protein
MWFLTQIAGWALGLACGFSFSQILALTYKSKKFGGWQLIVKNGDATLAIRLVGPKKAEELLDDPTTLGVFVKGVVSPFCWLNEDVLSEKGKTSGLFQVFTHQKTWLVDISKNPPAPPKPQKG